MPSPQVVLFRTFSKIDPKIRKISKFQTAVKIALVNEIHRNLRQMEALGFYFRDFFGILNFRLFCMFYSTLNIDHIRIFENDGKYRIYYVRLHVFSKNELLFSNFENPTFFSSPRLTECTYYFVHNYPKYRSRVKIRNVEPDFRFSGFPYINLLSKYFFKDFIKDFLSKSGKSEIWPHVSNFNSRSRIVINNLSKAFCSSRRAEKSWIFKI